MQMQHMQWMMNDEKPQVRNKNKNFITAGGVAANVFAAAADVVPATETGKI